MNPRTNFPHNPRLCPCGCGTRLETYNARRALVCFPMWQRVPIDLRKLIMLPEGILGTRAAVREVYRMAREVAAEREKAPRMEAASSPQAPAQPPNQQVELRQDYVADAQPDESHVPSRSLSSAIAGK